MEQLEEKRLEVISYCYIFYGKYLTSVNPNCNLLQHPQMRNMLPLAVKKKNHLSRIDSVQKSFIDFNYIYSIATIFVPVSFVRVLVLSVLFLCICV